MNPPPGSRGSTSVPAYGHLLAEASRLRRQDQINLVRALAGQVGMIAVFPNQLAQQAGPASGPGKSQGQKARSKGPAQRAPTNPLSGSPEKLAFDAAKKAVAKATRENGGQRLPESHPLVRRLNEAKDKYFRALSSAKGTSSAPATGWAEEVEEESSTV